MPPGAKKRKALKKKQQQQESIRTSTDNKGSTNGDNLLGNNQHGSQGDRESSNLSSPVSQGNEEFGGTKDPSASLSSGLVKDTAKKISDVTQGLVPKSGIAIAVERGTDDNKDIVVKSPISSNEISSQTTKKVASQDPCGDSIKEIAPVVDSVKPVVSVSKVVILEKSEHAETSTHSNLVKKKSSTGLEKDNGKVATLPGSTAGISRKQESVRASEVPVASEEKRLLLPGPPAVRTSWLSCCGLFDAMTGSDR